MQLPQSGQLVRFSEVPCGSYATAGEVYRVTYPKRRDGKLPNDLSLWNEKRQCGTIDRRWAWRFAAWEVVQG